MKKINDFHYNQNTVSEFESYPLYLDNCNKTSCTFHDHNKAYLDCNHHNNFPGCDLCNFQDLGNSNNILHVLKTFQAGEIPKATPKFSYFYLFTMQSDCIKCTFKEKKGSNGNLEMHIKRLLHKRVEICVEQTLFSTFLIL